ncbi:hypothetical protein [Pedobacter sp.]|uniref:hypothetical protein n=1 Tax=Pedobacter sp. TaxID=1411316 RepID=UPI0031D6232A
MMKQEALFRKLGNILNELNDQYQFLSQNPEQLSELELELFLANANFLADHIQIIKKLNLPFQAPLALTTPEAQEEPTIDEEIVDELKDVQQVEAITFGNAEEKVEPSFKQEPIAEEPSSIVEENKEVPKVVEEVEVPQVIEEKIEEIAPLVEHEKELFRLEEEPTKTFEFILNSESYTEEDKFDFEEKAANQLFDRPLSKEEELILEQKKKVKENLVRNPEDLEEDEIGPEPFLVHKEEEQHELPKAIDKPIIEEVLPVIETISKVTVETTTVEIETEYKPTLNDILAGKNNGTRLNETSGNNITDLKAAINLNDKLLYIKDLFNGYNLAYAEAIDIANKMPNFDAADNFFQKNYAVKNNWADKQATVDKFYLLLNRRFKD